MRPIFLILSILISRYAYSEIAYVNYEEEHNNQVLNSNEEQVKDTEDHVYNDSDNNTDTKKEDRDKLNNKTESNNYNNDTNNKDTSRNNLNVNSNKVSSRSLSNSNVNTNRAFIRSAPVQVVNNNNDINNTRGIRSRSTYNTATYNTTNTNTNRVINNNSIDNEDNTRSVNNNRYINNSNIRTVNNRGSNNVTARAGTLYKGRVSTSGGNYMVGARGSSNFRSGSSVSYSSSSTSNTPKVQERIEYEAPSQITEECKTEYQNCMDSFCAVLDDNQGRCACSDKVNEYADTEKSLKKATEELKELIQKIKYIGLPKEDVEALFKQTEGELALQNKTDTSALKTELDKIKSMILNVDDSTDSNADSDGLLDVSGLLNGGNDSDITNFDFDSLLGGKKTSIARQRGAKLKNSSYERCNTQVLKGCRARGADIKAITANYDLDIEKQCISYEKGLTSANDKMRNTIRNAQYFLQKARLVVAKQKNTYADVRSCVNALDKCMQDEFVCGDGYKNCLDPTGNVIYNGRIIKTYTDTKDANNSITTAKQHFENDINPFWDYGYCKEYNTDETCKTTGTKNSWSEYKKSNNTISLGNISDYITNSIGNFTDTSKGQMSVFIQNKIGHKNADKKNTGFCMSVLDKCQDSSYTKGVYNPKNEVVKTFLQRALMIIHNKQQDLKNSIKSSTN